MATASQRSIYILATLDTKGHEAAYVRDRLRALGCATTLVDTGCLGTAQVAADISRQELFAAAEVPLGELVAAADRGRAVTAAAAAAAALVRQHHAQGRVGGVLALGGSAGTTIGTAAMRACRWAWPR